MTRPDAPPQHSDEFPSPTPTPGSTQTFETQENYGPMYAFDNSDVDLESSV